MPQEGRNKDKEVIPGSGQSMQGYILTFSRLHTDLLQTLKGEHLSALGSQHKGS